MARPFIVIGPVLKIQRQNIVPLLDGSQVVQSLGYIWRGPLRMFWATKDEIEAQISAIQGSGWVLEGDPSPTPIYPPLDLYNVEASFIMYTST